MRHLSQLLPPCVHLSTWRRPCPADYALTLRGLEGEQREEAKRGCHQRGANRLLDVCFRNGGIYIKLGQHIGMLVRGRARAAAGQAAQGSI